MKMVLKPVHVVFLSKEFESGRPPDDFNECDGTRPAPGFDHDLVVFRNRHQNRHQTISWNRLIAQVLDFIGGRCRFRTCDPRL